MLKPNTIFANRYLLKKKIGVGGFSEVWKSEDQMAEDSVVAVKIYAAEKGLDEFGLKQFRREYANMLNVSHEHLVTARHFDIWESRPYLIMPIMEGGSLYQKMMEQGPMEEKEIAKVALQLSKGLNFLHSRGILHQDIKPENVLLDAEGKYHLTDFGISTRLRSTLRKTAAQADRSMTVSYAPPERFSGSQLPTKGGDVFSLGVLMYEMARGELPWMGAGGVVLFQNPPALELPPEYSPDLAKLINDCVQLNPEDRPSASELVNYCESYLRSGTWGLGSAETVNSKDEDYGRKTERKPRATDSPKKEMTGTDPPPPKPKGETRNRWLYSIPVLVLLGLAALFGIRTCGEPEEILVVYEENGPYGHTDRNEEALWQQAESTNSISVYNNYLEEYPNGRYSSEARNKISDIESRERAEAERQEATHRAAEEERRRQAERKTPAQLAAEEIASTMVRIPGGTFTMGCTSEQGSDCFDWERPAHQVTVSTFHINKYEVTQEQWRAIMGSNPSHNQGCDRCPVELVSWNDVQEFISKLNNLTGSNYRLPTEAEWEYAARGGENYKYAGSNNIGQVAWYGDNARQGNTHGSQKTTRPVGGKLPNGYGLYDMSCNVWEWCSDWYGSYSGESKTNPKGPSSGSFRVFRGGSWGADARRCRVSFRFISTPSDRRNDLGFRLAR